MLSSHTHPYYLVDPRNGSSARYMLLSRSPLRPFHRKQPGQASSYRVGAINGSARSVSSRRLHRTRSLRINAFRQTEIRRVDGVRPRTDRRSAERCIASPATRLVPTVAR